MGIFNRDDDRSRGFRGHYDRDLGHAQGGGAWDHVERGFRGRDPNDVGMRGDEHLRREQGTWGRSNGYDRDMSPTEAGWRAGGMSRGGRDRGGYDRGMHGGDRNFLERAGGSVRRGWNELTGDDYDRGYRGGGWGRNDMDLNDMNRNDLGRNDYGSEYGRGMRGAAWVREGRYGQGVGYEPGFPRDRHGYDRHEYKSRYQTDAGDPFGDRQRHTPVRMVNEDYADRLARRNAYDADIRRERDWF
jgi:hypothetical protein